MSCPSCFANSKPQSSHCEARSMRPAPSRACVAFGLGLPACRKMPIWNAVPGDGPPVAGRAVRIGLHGHDFISLVRIGIGRRMLECHAFGIIDFKPSTSFVRRLELDRLAVAGIVDPNSFSWLWLAHLRPCASASSARSRVWLSWPDGHAGVTGRAIL